MKKITLKPFVSLCKKTAKTGQLFLQSVDKEVYISDGCFIVKVSRYTYDKEIRPDLIFDVPENGKVKIDRNKLSIIDNPSFIDFKDNFENESGVDFTPCTMTGLIIENTWNSDTLLRIFKSENGLTAIDTKYVNALLWFGFASAKVDKERPERSPIKTNDFKILPVRINALDTIKQVVENI